MDLVECGRPCRKLSSTTIWRVQRSGACGYCACLVGQKSRFPDESGFSLDPRQRADFVTLEVNKQTRTTIVLITHEMQIVKEGIANRVAVIQRWSSDWKRRCVLEIFSQDNKQPLTQDFISTATNLSMKLWGWIEQMRHYAKQHFNFNSSIWALLQIDHFWMNCTSTAPSNESQYSLWKYWNFGWHSCWWACVCLVGKKKPWQGSSDAIKLIVCNQYWREGQE